MPGKDLKSRLKEAHAVAANGDLRKARELLSDINEVDTSDLPALCVLGELHLKLGNAKKSARILESVLAHGLDQARVHNGLARACLTLNKTERALKALQRSIQLEPGSAYTYVNLGVALHQAGREKSALQAYQQAVSLKPDLAMAHYNLGQLLAKHDRLPDAEAELKLALASDPELVDAWSILGGIHHGKREFDAALACYENGLRLDPGHANLHRNKALTLLLTGRMQTGWREFAWHHRCADVNWPQIDIPVWDGSSLEGKTLLVHGEQGVGDQVMMMPVMSGLIDRARHVILECDPRLVTLAMRSFPAITARTDRLHNRHVNDQGIDCHIPAGAIYQYLHKSNDVAGAYEAFLEPDPQASRHWKNAFKDLGNNLKVGISWRGGTGIHRQHRSINLDQWTSLLSIPGVKYIDLQYGNHREEIDRVEEQPDIRIHRFNTNPEKDLDNFSAQISALDLVITVDNSTAHVAGALGIPTWVMLPYTPDWRWLLKGDRSYWYKNLRLFRQQSLGGWDAVLNQVESCLKEKLASMDSRSG